MDFAKIVFVIGMHRCGTSLVTSILTEMGFSTGISKNKDKDWQNPNGYYENDALLYHHNKMLAYNGNSYLNVTNCDLSYTDEHVADYVAAIKKEFEGTNKIVIKDPRLSFFVSFLYKVAEKLNSQCYLIFCTRDRHESASSLSKAQQVDIDSCFALYDVTEQTRLKHYHELHIINYNQLLENSQLVVNRLGTFINENTDINNTLVEPSLYRNQLTFPIEIYPRRTPLDICYAMEKYTKDKVVCDIGCGAGDIISYLLRNNMCKDVIGIENDKSRLPSTRKFVIFGDALTMPTLPDADVYIFWIGVNFPYARVLQKIKKGSEKIVFNLCSTEINHEEFLKTSRYLTLLEKITYTYDESIYINSKEKIKEFNSFQHIQDWKITGERFFKAYRYYSPITD